MSKIQKIFHTEKLFLWLTIQEDCVKIIEWSEFLLLAKAEEVSFLQKYEYEFNKFSENRKH
jgi:hypothetical protein